MQTRRTEIKQTSLPFPSKLLNQPRIFSHRKTKSNNLLQKKPQILLMKWNYFLEHYHMHKQLNSINHSLNMVGMHLNKKKQNLVIHDVPYIQSEQVSVDQKYVEDQVIMTKLIKDTKVQTVKINLKKTSSIKQSDKIKQVNNSKKQGSTQNRQEQNKIIVSIQFNQQNDILQKSQNFTDEEETESLSQKQTKMQSTNKNSNINFSFEDRQDSKQVKSKCSKAQQQQTEVADYLRKTAFFSFNTNLDKQKQKKVLVTQRPKFNQQNFNYLNKQIRGKKVQVLLKLQNQQQIRRQKAQKIIKQDREFLTKIMNKNELQNGKLLTF